MKEYIVYAKYTSYCYVVVNANSPEEAEQIAYDMDGGEFTPSEEPFGDWEIAPEKTRELRGDESD